VADGYPAPEPCFDFTGYSGVLACGTVTVLGGNFSADGVTWRDNVATTDASFTPVGAALTFFANETSAALAVSGSAFLGNRATQLVVGSGFWSTALGGAVGLWENGLPGLVAPPQLAPYSFTNCTFSDNSVFGNGGAIFSAMTHGWLLLDGCAFSRNSASVNTQQSGRGGALYTAGSQFAGGFKLTPDFPTFAAHTRITVRNCAFDSNAAPTPNAFHNGLAPSGRGGTICFDSFPYAASIINSSFTGNTAYQGGAVYYHGTGSISHDQVAPLGFNDTDLIYFIPPGLSTDVVLVSSSDYVSLAPFAPVTGYALTISGSSFDGNVAASDSQFVAGMAGGALHVWCGEVDISDSSFTGNAVTDAGAACGGLGGAISLKANECPVLGGGVSTRLNVTASLFEGNAALRGAAIGALNFSAFAGETAITLRRANFSGNAPPSGACAAQQGGALFLSAKALLDSAGSTFANNRAANGSAIYLAGDAALTSAADTYAANAAQFGAAVYAGGASAALTGATFAANVAGVAAGVFLAAGTASAATPPGAPPATNVAQNYGPIIAAVPSAFLLSLSGAPYNASASAPLSARSGAPLELLLTLSDAFNQTVTFWQDFTLDVACVSMLLATAAAAAAAAPVPCPAAALQGAQHAAYFSASAALPTLSLTGAIGATFTLAATLASPTIPMFAAPGGRVVALRVTVAPCAAAETFNAQLQRCECSPGTFFDAGAGACAPCVPGWTSGGASTACAPCPGGTYEAANACLPCPLGSSSAAGSGALALCVCGYGFYPVFPATTATSAAAAAAAAASSFTCATCPAGALCDTARTGSLVPLALDGFWHPPNVSDVFYDCDAGRCLAEDAPSEAARRRQLLSGAANATLRSANCREGHTGAVCAVCAPGWSLAGEFCAACPPGEAFTSWSRDQLGGFLFAMFFIFLVGSLAVLLKPLLKAHAAELLPPRVGARLRRMSTRLSGSAAAAVLGGKRASAARALYEYTAVPLRLSVESLQIISSFRKNLLLTWPPVYTAIIKRLTILNFSFLTLPSTACATPRTSLYNLMNGITLSTTLLLAYMALLWAVGRSVMRARGWEASRVTAFDRKTVLRTMGVLTFVYTPITDVVLAVFSCRTILDQKYLRQDMEHMCYVGAHVRYAKVAAFWTALYVVGIPLAFVALLYAYHVPQVAAELQRAAALRALMDAAQRTGGRGLPRGAALVTRSADDDDDDEEDGCLRVSAGVSIREEHLAALYRQFVIGTSAPENSNGDAADAKQNQHAELPPLPLRFCCPVLASPTPAAPLPPPSEQLSALLRYAAAHAPPPRATWDDARGDPRLAGAEDTIGSLYREFHPHAWYWAVAEALQKLLVTGVLAFIAPGRIGQVVAGLFMTLCFLLAYARVAPYEDKVYRQIGFVMALVLFLFFVFALLVKAGVDTMSDAAATAAFNDACLGILTAATFAVPVIMVALRLRWPMGRAGKSEAARGSSSSKANGVAATTKSAADDEESPRGGAQQAAAPEAALVDDAAGGASL
jgi:hypothetical protein